MLEICCAETNTVFTPNKELNFALHEMHEVSGLFMRKSPFEEYVPGPRELDHLATKHPQIAETFWEPLCIIISASTPVGSWIT